ncbi:diguanylate cyclase [Pseudomonas aeruginosa]|uniref:diguanylate cyclase n=1 Tax=Pseudomonas aeruginosa TaxID=287 RepID=UPI00398301A4
MLACPLPPDEALRQQALDDMALVDTPAEHYLDALVELARETFGVKTVLISLIDHDRQWFKARIGLDAEQTPRDLSFCGHAILASEPLMVTDASRDPRFHDNPLVTGPPFIRFYAGEPLHASNGQAIGTLCLIDPSPRLLDLREGRQLNRLSILAEGYLQLRSLTEHTRFLRQEIDREQRKSLLDPLTQLWNRAGFHALHQHELELARAGDQRIGIIYSDIDHFKRINDTLGHRAGDSVLREAASRLRAALRPEDLLARFGGEEFVAMVRVRETTELTMIANRIRELMEATPIDCAGTSVPVTISAGCTLAGSGEEPERALARADAALYDAKRAGRNRVVSV